MLRSAKTKRCLFFDDPPFLTCLENDISPWNALPWVLGLGTGDFAFSNEFKRTTYEDFSMTTMNAINGTTQQRKSLSGQLDRLDQILDGLDQAIPSAVADAVRESVTVAVGEARTLPPYWNS